MTGFSSTRIQIACMDLFQSSTKFNREDATLRQKKSPSINSLGFDCSSDSFSNGRIGLDHYLL